MSKRMSCHAAFLYAKMQGTTWDCCHSRVWESVLATQVSYFYLKVVFGPLRCHRQSRYRRLQKTHCQRSVVSHFSFLTIDSCRPTSQLLIHQVSLFAVNGRQVTRYLRERSQECQLDFNYPMHRSVWMKTTCCSQAAFSRAFYASWTLHNCQCRACSRQLASLRSTRIGWHRHSCSFWAVHTAPLPGPASIAHHSSHSHYRTGRPLQSGHHHHPQLLLCRHLTIQALRKTHRFHHHLHHLCVSTP